MAISNVIPGLSMIMRHASPDESGGTLPMEDIE
jgi:hypothetical protein